MGIGCLPGYLVYFSIQYQVLLTSAKSPLSADSCSQHLLGRFCNGYDFLAGAEETKGLLFLDIIILGYSDKTRQGKTCQEGHYKF